MGLSLNEIVDEIECTQSLDKTFFIIAIVKFANFPNPEDSIVYKFLDINQFTMSACGISKCREPLIYFAINFANTNHEIFKDPKTQLEIYFESYDEKNVNVSESRVFNYFVMLFIFYIVIKIIVGIIRVIYMPKGYEIYVAKILT